MKVKDLFHIGGITQILERGGGEYLTENNAVVRNKTWNKNDHSVVLHLQRDSDGKIGQASLRVLPEYKTFEERLLRWAFNNDSLQGMSLEEIRFLDTNLQISSVKRRM